MIRQFTSDLDKTTVLDYIGDNYYRCIYLYLDLYEFNLNDGVIKCWGQYDGSCRLSSVMLKYHGALHIYSEQMNYDRQELVDFLKTVTFNIICGRSEIIEDLKSSFPSYTPELGVVGQLKAVPEGGILDVGKASISDIDDIARLLYSDKDGGASYELADLVAQLKERYIRKYSRFYVIRKGDKIVANLSTGGETEKMATLTNLIVGIDYRRQGFASKLFRKMCSDLLNEGKEVYSIYYVPESVALHSKNGFSIRCGYGKLFKRTH